MTLLKDRSKGRLGSNNLLPVSNKTYSKVSAPSLFTLLIRACILISIISLLMYVGYIQSTAVNDEEDEGPKERELELKKYQEQNTQLSNNRKFAESLVASQGAVKPQGSSPKVQRQGQEQGQLDPFYSISALDISGQLRSMKEFIGKVLLIVNVASECGYTDSNYRGLQQLYAKYKDQGFEILAFPCNQFGMQEPDDNAQILEFVKKQFGVTFQMFAKIDVNGDGAHQLFKYLKQWLPTEEGGGGGTEKGKELEWNFSKFLIDRTGKPRRLFHAPFVANEIEQAIQILLQEQQNLIQ
eukprot:TRINITY_DN3692_c0_g1_i4.p2 TRINITY_DN3692_c0_g1~~TRINITY_DN3692_c0_g1_i4.p2  ORF type:complete len:297 (+),score=38.04 TRINITY_DN3692_c0_g1_i4:175-1065(+)